MNVIIFIIRVLKLLLMNYRFVQFVVLFSLIIAIPVSASLTKIAVKSPVFIGETGIDISSPLNGCKQIAWWPAGNDTGTPPDKILEIKGDIYSYNMSPEIFSGYEGTWYCWDPKPVLEVFYVKKPEFSFRIWDLDQNRDISGQSVPQSRRVTYRIDTNLCPVVNYLNRSDKTPLDRFFDVGLKGPYGADIINIYTGNAGALGTLTLTFDSKPDISTSPYIWRDGGSWNHTARSGDGTYLFPLGTYTFTASQNLNNMRYYYGDTVGVTTSDSVNITFIPDVIIPSPTVTATTLTMSPTTIQPTSTMATSLSTVVTSRAITPPTKKPTWTSTPLPFWLPTIAVIVAFCLSGYCRCNKRI
jgi:hypothetical protein